MCWTLQIVISSRDWTVGILQFSLPRVYLSDLFSFMIILLDQELQVIIDFKSNRRNILSTYIKPLEVLSSSIYYRNVPDTIKFSNKRFACSKIKD